MEILISDIKLYQSLPKKHRSIFVDTKKEYYSKYYDIIELFNTITEKSINELANAIKDKYELGYENQEIFDEYDEEWHGLIKYITEHSNCIPKKIIEIKDNDENIPNKFKWNQNQISGWTSAINNNFASGIHSQATGTGKSLMALKIIWEYHKRNPKNNIMWLCERKDIPQKLFFKITNDSEILFNEKNFIFWKKHDIIDMHKFTIKEYVYEKNDPKWMDKLDALKSNKPLFIIINRAYLTSGSNYDDCKYKYEELQKNIPKFVILDECHSAMANRTYTLLLYIKHNWGANIQGLSATPYRKGKSYTTIDIDINCEDEEIIKTDQNENKLINIFHKQGNINELNILSWFNLKEAIEQGIILEPIFHWFHIKKYISKNKKKSLNKKYTNSEITSVMTVLNDIVEQCKYKKCVVWCRLKEIANNWYNIFKKEKYKYANLQKMKSFIDHSNVSTKHASDYDRFYEIEDNAIMFCASKYREGSDIPYLSCCLFLDKVKNRGELPFIQCIGRVLRKDENKLKRNGHVIDGCTIEDDESKMKDIINKLIKYYLNLYEISKSDFEYVVNPNNKMGSKLALYNKIMSSLRLAPDEKKIYIDLENNKKIILDLENIDLKTMEWNKIIPKFDKILKNNLVMSEYEEYVAFKNRVKKLRIKNLYEYNNCWRNYGLFLFDDEQDKIIKINPKKRFPAFFKNWYDFLDINTDNFLKTKEEWKKRCKFLGLTKNNYLDEVIQYPELPNMPEEFYKDFTNLSDELKNKNYVIL